MTPSAIKKKEDLFFSTLKTISGVQYSITKTTDIGGAKIYSIHPPYSTYYYQTKTSKKSICLHFTVGYITSDVSTLSTDGSHVSVSYTVDRCGRIYELFDDAYWSYHLGNAAVGGNGTMSKQSIGIEISNYGPLKLDGKNLIDAYKNVYCTLADKDCYFEHDYRGYHYFATMTVEQMDAVAALIRHLSAKHNIPIQFKMDDSVFASAAEATGFKGVYCHTNVRKDKFDWPFCDQIQYIISKCLPVPQATVTPTKTQDSASPDPHQATTGSTTPITEETQVPAPQDPLPDATPADVPVSTTPVTEEKLDPAPTVSPPADTTSTAKPQVPDTTAVNATKPSAALPDKSAAAGNPIIQLIVGILELFTKIFHR